MKPRICRIVVTASTNDDAVKAALAGEAEGLVIHALKQTAGRGRHGRVWESPKGNLYCSVLLRPSCEPKNYGQYSFVASLALGDVVREFLPPYAQASGGRPQSRVTLKWPNDVLVDGKKIAGILVESGEGYLVVGIGLNVLHHPENALYPSTSLYKECIGSEGGDIPLSLREGLGEGALSKKPSSILVALPPHPISPSRGEEFHRASFEIDHILQKLLNHLSRRYTTIQSEGFAPIRAAWLERAHKGRMTVKLPDQTMEGDFIDIDAQGHLCLRLVNGTERVVATGDVFLAGVNHATRTA